MTDDSADLTTWNPFHTKHWPRSIVRPQEYDGSDKLTLSWDLGAVVSEKAKKQVIKEWCATLPTLQNVRWLNIWSHVTQPIFDAACQMIGLECLQIKWSGIKDLSAIQQLQQLRFLYCGSSTKVESVQPLAALSKLKLLSIENFKLISDFSPLTRLTKLESLMVTGSMWSKQDVGSLEPFSRMTWLQSMVIDTSKVKSLRPLQSLVNLKLLDMGGRLPMEEYAWLSVKLPNTECRWFAPYLDLASSGTGRCDVCKQNSQVMLTGKGAGVVCRICDREKVQRHEAAFAAAQASARA